MLKTITWYILKERLTAKGTPDGAKVGRQPKPLATRLLEIKYRPLSWSDSHMTYLKSFCRKTSTAHPASRQPGHGASTPEATPGTVGLRGHGEAVSSRNVDLISRWHKQREKTKRLRNAEER